MEPTKDGYVHQTRQDDIFEELETFAQCAYVCLLLTAIQRTLTPEEAYVLQRAADLGARFLSPAVGRWQPTRGVLAAMQ